MGQRRSHKHLKESGEQKLIPLRRGKKLALTGGGRKDSKCFTRRERSRLQERGSRALWGKATPAPKVREVSEEGEAHPLIGRYCVRGGAITNGREGCNKNRCLKIGKTKGKHANQGGTTGRCWGEKIFGQNTATESKEETSKNSEGTKGALKAAGQFNRLQYGKTLTVGRKTTNAKSTRKYLSHYDISREHHKKNITEDRRAGAQ